MSNSQKHPLVLPLLRLSADEASELDYFDLCDKAWGAVTSACAASNFAPEGTDSSQAQDLFIDLLPSHWRTAFAVHEMEYDVLAGGFITFFYNHEDRLVAAASKGLEDIGALKHRHILLEAATYIDDEDELGPFGSEFYDASQSDGDPRERLAEFIRANLGLFTSSK